MFSIAGAAGRAVAPSGLAETLELDNAKVTEATLESNVDLNLFFFINPPRLILKEKTIIFLKNREEVF
jgi:hypothetical protein